MCGFAGYVGALAGFSSSDWAAILQRMGSAIAHRGPDDDGVWMDAVAGIGLAHRRLSIVDLSAAGHQPMVSASGRFVIAFNGEIYNHLSLRHALRVVGGNDSWRGHSDTETLLTGFEAWGIEATLKACVGMFAIALWDKNERTLYLARDRIGEKPLYYGWQKGIFLFGSELKALEVHPAFERRIDRDALTLMLRHNYIPAPYSIYQGIRKLPPATYLKFPVGKKSGEPMPFWSLREVAKGGQKQAFSGNDADAVSGLEERLKESIGLQMIADVPLGAFLSGGVDSSTVVALMQSQSNQRVKTYTIGFQEKGYNEAEHARVVAKHLGTDHTELYITSEEARAVIPSLPILYDEPFSDSSQIPTFLVSKMARQHVKVALSGDGGDELFGGYNRYFVMEELWKKIGRLPQPLRAGLSKMIDLVPPNLWTALGSVLFGKILDPAEKVRKVSEILSAPNPEMIYRLLVSHWKAPVDVVIGATEPSTILTDEGRWPDIRDFEHRMMYLDALSYLPDGILVKVDRAAMGVSLETRVPYLDHRVVEFAWQLPLSMKIRNGQGKWILRQVLYKHVPKTLIDRPKMGFGVPIDSWLRGPLREWAEALLEEGRLKSEGFFHPTPIRKKWSEHLNGKRNWQYYLWDVLMFQAWLERQSRRPVGDR